MKVYFVRHGESDGNAKRIHQDGYATLSEKGISQAETLAKRFETIEIDKVIASTFERAKQTAEIINKTINKPIEYSDLFIERKRPTAIEGLEYIDTEAVRIKDEITSNYHDPDFKHSDEETFFEIKDRAVKALDFIRKSQDNNILVVTHSDFIICMLGIMIFGDKLTSLEEQSFMSSFKSNNTGITLCEFTDRWRIRTWNDHAHLG